MQDYGLYLEGDVSPMFRGTESECRERMRKLSNGQCERGWTIAPIPVDQPYAGPVVDPDLARSVKIVCIAFIAMVILLGLTILTAR
jgi:hypothetical protein